MINENLIDKLPKIRGTYRQNCKIKTWFDVGGNAEIVFRPADIEDLKFFLKNISKNIAINVIGAGSNVIISDDGVKGVVIKLDSSFAKIEYQNNLLNVGSAMLCGNVALYCKNNGLGNLEFLTGIPGSVGGALAMNAGCYGFDISQFLLTAKAINYQGEVFEIVNKDFGFFYRGNKIAKEFIFLEASFKIKKSSPENVLQKIIQFQTQREIAQPIRAKTGGSTFKNPLNLKAWELIDKSGCRGLTIGDAQVSTKHCNFLINNGNAKASDLINLGNEVQKKVKEICKIDLEWEIKIIK